MSKRLEIWQNGQHVGQWMPGSRTQSRLRYEPSWIDNPDATPLSLSMPLPLSPQDIEYHHRGALVDDYFENLLPDNQAIRNRIKDRYRTRNTQAYSLLSEIGRDCVGAIQLMPPGMAPEWPPRMDSMPMSDADIEMHLRETTSTHRQDMGVGREFRISLAGAQEKTALLWRPDLNAWHAPIGATPTTHIFKLPLGLIGGRMHDMSESVENEWLCARILNAFGVDTPYCEIAQFGEQRVLIVERFDRMWDPHGVLWRLPQEDCCQALGMPPNKKYESDGGPTMRHISQLLSTSVHGSLSTEIFLTAQVLFFLLAATDGHAKNYSIQLLSDNRYQLCPLYDILSLWPVIGDGPNQLPLRDASMAMGFKATRGTKRALLDIWPRHIEATAKVCGCPNFPYVVESIMDSLDPIMEAVHGDLPPGFPVRIFESIYSGMRTMRDQYWSRT